MEKLRKLLVCSAAVVCQIALAPAVFAEPILGDNLATFAVLGATPSVTNVTGPIGGSTTLTGQIGVSPASSITGLENMTVNGWDGADPLNPYVHLGDSVAMSGQEQLGVAITSLGLLSPSNDLGVDLTGRTLAPGVYTVHSGATNLAGTVTLDGAGDVNALWVFQMTGDLITSVGSTVNLINVGLNNTNAGVYWVLPTIGGSASLKAGTTFVGNILAQISITMGDDVTLSCGRALARTGTVTMIGDTISAGCTGTGLEFDTGGNIVDTTSPSGGTGGGGTVATAVPEPGTLLLLGLALTGLAATKRSMSMVHAS
jgi:hypothetical protein